MNSAAENIRETLGEKDQVGDCQVSVGGTWQKRGFASRTGVVTVIAKDNEKCIDYQVLSKHCKGCQVWMKKKIHQIILTGKESTEENAKQIISSHQEQWKVLVL